MNSQEDRIEPLDIEDFHFEPVSKLIEVFKDPKSGKEYESIRFDVFNGKFIGYLDIMLGPPSNWHFVEGRQVDGSNFFRSIIGSLSTGHRINLSELLSELAHQAVKCHRDNKKLSDSAWEHVQADYALKQRVQPVRV